MRTNSSHYVSHITHHVLMATDFLALPLISLPVHIPHLSE